MKAVFVWAPEREKKHRKCRFEGFFFLKYANTALHGKSILKWAFYLGSLNQESLWYTDVNWIGFAPVDVYMYNMAGWAWHMGNVYKQK